MDWLAGRLDVGTSARSRRGGFGDAPGPGGWGDRSGWEQATEFSHLLLQGGELSLHHVQLLRQREQGSRQWWVGVGRGGRRHWGEGSQAALMEASEHFEMLAAQPPFA